MTADPRIVTVVQARVGSSRLPGKALRALCGRPLILHVLERARAMGYLTWLATTDQASDDPLADLVIREGYPVYRGAERDVLRRIYETALVAQAEVVVRVTGDCPLFAPDVGRAVVGLLAAQGWAGIATNDTIRSGYPDGLDVEVCALERLAAADAAIARVETALDPKARDEAVQAREHVTPWIRKAGPHHMLKADADLRRVKLSVDDAEDFERVRTVLAHCAAFEWPATRAAWQRVASAVERSGR